LRALRLGTRDAALEYHAGVIYADRQCREGRIAFAARTFYHSALLRYFVADAELEASHATDFRAGSR
jgi:hypothetical protein